MYVFELELGKFDYYAFLLNIFACWAYIAKKGPNRVVQDRTKWSKIGGSSVELGKVDYYAFLLNIFACWAYISETKPDWGMQCSSIFNFIYWGMFWATKSNIFVQERVFFSLQCSAVCVYDKNATLPTSHSKTNNAILLLTPKINFSTPN